MPSSAAVDLRQSTSIMTASSGDGICCAGEEPPWLQRGSNVTAALAHVGAVADAAETIGSENGASKITRQTVNLWLRFPLRHPPTEQRGSPIVLTQFYAI